MADSNKSDIPRTLSRRGMARVNLFGEKVVRQNEEDYQKTLKAYESEQIVDPFKGKYASSFAVTGSQNVLAVPYNPYTLIRFPQENNVLRQCIDAMVINIEAMGHRLEYVGPEGESDSEASTAEKARLEALLLQPNGEYGLLELRERRRRDIETVGYGYIEVCRGDYSRKISSYYHVPAETVRMTAADAEDTPVPVFLFREGKWVQQVIKRRFRRYVQEVGGQRVYFKEFGDPRTISAANGQVYDGADRSQAATELLYTGLYTPGSPYGTPRYVNQLPSILGSREAEMTNLQFFKDNTIPAMAVLVSGGQLTSEAMNEIEEHISAVQGRQSVHRVLILEAESTDSAPGTNPQAPKLELKPLTGERQNDALFLEYDKSNQQKIRSSFRLSPLLLGMSEDVTYAIAEASLVVGEAQVFGPERNKTDDLFNNQILSDEEGRPPTFWRMRSLPPRISDPTTTINALTALNNVGALTPNVAIGIANELFDLSIKMIEDDWGNYPFSAVTALISAGRFTGMEEIASAAGAASGIGGLPAFRDLTPKQQDAVSALIVKALSECAEKAKVA